MSMKLRNSSVVTIKGWMSKELKLSGNDLIIFAVLQRFTEERGEYSSGYQFLADSAGCDRITAIKVIQRLAQRGLIDKVDEVENGRVIRAHLSTLRNEVE